MKVELIKSLDQRTQPATAWQIEEVRSGRADYLLLYSPHEDAQSIIESLSISAEQVIDLASQSPLTVEEAGEGQFLFDYPVPNQGRIESGQNGRVFFESNGQLLAEVTLYAKSYYLIQAIEWFNRVGDVSRKTIYQRNGRRFAQQYFSQKKVLQSDFYFGTKQVQLSNFYHEGLQDFTVALGKSYPSYAAVVQNYLTNHYSQVEIEVTDPSLTSIVNQMVLTLPEHIVAKDGQIPAGLTEILLRENHPVQTIRVGAEDFEWLASSGYSTKKLEIISF